MLYNIFSLILECVKILLVLCGILNLKYKKRAPYAWSVLFICVICLVIKGVQDNEYRVSTFLCLSVVICALLIEVKKRFLLSLVCYMGICCMDELTAFVVRTIFSVSHEMLTNNRVLLGVVNSVSAVLLLVIALFMCVLCKNRWKIREAVQDISGVHLVLCTLGTLAVTLMMSAIGNEHMVWDEAQIQMIAGCSCIFGCVFIMLWILLVYNNNSKKTYKRMAEINDKLLETQEKYYGMLLEKENETRRFRHDIANHILCLDVLLKEQDYREADIYLEKIRGNLQELGVKVQTGNRLVNAIINDISQKYEDVTFDWSGAFPQNMALSNMDICTIFSNTLENAFFAASGCESEKKVEMEVKEIGQGLKVTVKNNMSWSIKVKEGKYLTGKADKKNHGFGIKNVGECVKRNGGRVEYSYTKDSFTAKIILVNVL